MSRYDDAREAERVFTQDDQEAVRQAAALIDPQAWAPGTDPEIFGVARRRAISTHAATRLLDAGMLRGRGTAESGR